MSNYEIVTVSEAELEDLVRAFCDKLETGLRYITHQTQTIGGRLDMLFVDSGNSLVVAELKVVEDDQMLMQALDYYDYLARNIEAFSRIASTQGVDPTQKPRMFLIAPSYSSQLLARAKWLTVPISIFRYKIIKLGEERIPVFIEEEIEEPPESVEFSTLEQHLSYIKNPDALARARRALAEFQAIDPTKVVIDPRQSAISLKFSGRVIAYIHTQRQRFIIGTHKDGVWTRFPIDSDAELAAGISLAKQRIEALKN